MFTMCICELVKNLKVIGGKVRKVKDEEETKIYCVRFWERLNKFLEEECQDVGDKISGLELAWENLSSNRQYMKECGEVQELCHILFLACARVILSMEWENLPSDDAVRESFQAGLTKCETKMVEFGHNQISLLINLIKNKWSEPTLIKIMVGEEDVDEAEVGVYLHSLPHDILRLRLSLLMEGKCDEYALNLSSWLVRLKIFQQDVDILQKHLVLLLKQGMRDQFHKKCAKVACHTAVDIINCVKNQPEYKEDALILAQTFLGQDLFRPSYYCCTKALLKIWAELQYEKDQDRETFIQSVMKMSKLARNSLQMTFFAEILFDMFDDKFLQLCTEFLLLACKADAVQFLFYKGGGTEFNPSGLRISLIHICHLLSGMYRQHKKLRQLVTLTAFSLDPSEELFKFVELLHNVLSEQASDAETDESASTIITADVDSDKGKTDDKEMKKDITLKCENDGTKLQDSDSDKVLVKGDSKDNASSEDQNKAESMQTDQNNCKEEHPTKEINIKPDTQVEQSSNSENVLEKTTDNALPTVNRNNDKDIRVKDDKVDKLDECVSTNSLDEEECLPMCKKHGCCKQNNKSDIVSEQRPLERQEELDSVVNLVEPVKKSVCKCASDETCKEKDDDSQIVSEIEKEKSGENVDNVDISEPMEMEVTSTEVLPNGESDALSDACTDQTNEVKNNDDSEELVEDRCTVFERDVDDDIPQIVSMCSKPKVVSHGGTKSGGFSAKFEQWLLQNAGAKKMEDSETPEEKTPTSTTEVAETSPSSLEIEEESITNGVSGEETPECSSTTEIESSRDENEPERKRRGRPRRNADDLLDKPTMTSRTRGKDKRKVTDDEEEGGSEEDMKDRRRRRKVVKYEEYCTDQSESSSPESDAETVVEEDLHGVAVPGVDKKLLCDLLCICDRLRDETLNPDLPWEELRDRCLSMFGSGAPIVKQEPMEVKREIEEPQQPVHFIEPIDVIDAAPEVNTKPLQPEIIPPEIQESVAMPIPTVVEIAPLPVVPPPVKEKKISQNRRKRSNSSNVIAAGNVKRIILPSSQTLGAVEKTHRHIGSVPVGMSYERQNHSASAKLGLNVNKSQIVSDAAAALQKLENSQTGHNVKDSFMVNQVTSAFRKINSTKTSKNRNESVVPGQMSAFQKVGAKQRRQIVNDSLMVSRTTSALHKLDSEKPRPKILMNKKNLTVCTNSSQPRQMVQHQALPYVPLVDQFHVPVPTTMLSPTAEAPLASPLVSSSISSSADTYVPTAVQPVATMASAVLQKPSVLSPAVQTSQHNMIHVPNSNVARVAANQSFPSVLYHSESNSQSNIAKVSAHQTSPSVVYHSDTTTSTPSPRADSPQFVAVQGQQGQQQVVLLKSPAGQTVTYTASGGKVYKIWNSKNYSRYNLGQGQRVVGIRPLVRTPSPDVGDVSSSNSPISQTVSMGNCMVTPTQASSGITANMPLMAVNVPQSRSAPLISTNRTIPIVPAQTVQQQPLTVVETQLMAVPNTQLISVPCSSLPVTQIQTMTSIQSCAAQTQPLSIAQYQQANVAPNRPIQAFPMTQTQQLPNVTLVHSAVSRAPVAQSPGSVDISYAGTFPEGTSESDILTHVMKQKVMNFVQRTTTSSNVSPAPSKGQNSVGITTNAKTVKDMLHNQVQNQQSALVNQQLVQAVNKQFQAVNTQFGNAAEARIRHLLQTAGVQTTSDGKVLLGRRQHPTVNNTNSLLQASQMAGFKSTSTSNSAVQTVSQVTNKTTAVPSNQLLARQALQNRQRSLTGMQQVVISNASTSAMLQTRPNKPNVQPKNQEIIVLSDSDSDSDYWRRNEKRVTYSKKDREPVLSVLAKSLTEKIPETSSHLSHSKLHQQFTSSTAYTPQQMAALVANSRTLMDQVVREKSAKSSGSAHSNLNVKGKGHGHAQVKKVSPKKSPPLDRVNIHNLPVQRQVPFTVDKNSSNFSQVVSKFDSVSSTVGAVIRTQNSGPCQNASPIVKTIPIPGGVPVQNIDNRPTPLANYNPPRPVSPVPQGQSVYLGQNDITPPRILVVNDAPLTMAQVSQAVLSASIPIPVASIPPN